MELATLPTITAATATVNPLRIRHLLESFIKEKDVKEASRHTYRRSLQQYFSWVDRKGYLLSEIARPQILEYKNEMIGSKKSDLTIGSYITSVRQFYEWTEANKYYPNVAKGVKSPKRKQEIRKQPLISDQATILLNYYKNKSLRDFALANLRIRTGLRDIEVTRANVGDIVFKGAQRVLLIQGKGWNEKNDFVILTDKAYEPIETYLATRGKLNDDDPLFCSESNNNRNQRLTTRTTSFIIKEGLKAIGLNHKCFTSHSLRHTAAVNILEAGGSLEMAQYTLRHSSPATTQIYTAWTKERRRIKNSGEALLDSMY